MSDLAGLKLDVVRQMLGDVIVLEQQSTQQVMALTSATTQKSIESLLNADEEKHRAIINMANENLEQIKLVVDRKIDLLKELANILGA